VRLQGEIMAKKWYVVHTYSGYEAKAKTALLDKIKSLKKEELFGEVLIPEENVVEMVKGKKRTQSRKFFPGYMLVQMDMNEEAWHIVRSTPKVTGFVGGGKNPPSIPDEEVARITSRITEGTMKPKAKYTFEKGESIRVIDGPFQNFNGVVDEVKPDKGKLRVLVSIFGRATSVELDFIQVEKN
jgi:transcription termination/antitermination protein NusG